MREREEEKKNAVTSGTFCWSALATAPTSASAGAKEASNSTELFFAKLSSAELILILTVRQISGH